ncbi:MAG: leucine-rich repeat protein [Clostridia bacterium]|nr:leucine-rich repeat protein [Clostridia bacterium]
MKRTLKRLLSLFLAAVMLFGASPIGALSEIDFTSLRDLFTVEAEAAAYSGTCGDNLTWSFDDSTGELVISGTGDMTNWSSYSYVPWYSYRSSIKSVSIGDSVTSIGNYAFYDCGSLTSVTIGNSVKSIGDEAFYDCKSLTSMIIPDSVTSIGMSAFYGVKFSEELYEDGVLYLGRHLIDVMDSFKGDFVIDDGTLTIYDKAFYDCDSLTSVTIPDSVTSIGDNAFWSCGSLTSITIPDSVTSIGDWAFAYSAYYNKTSNWENGVLYIGKHLIKATNTNSGEYTIKNGTLIIADSAFSSCTNLTSVTIPGSVTSIGNGAFEDCSSLTSITIPDSVTSIGDRAFVSCESLTSVTIGNSVTSIGNSAFAYCNGLTSVTIGNGVTSIGKCAFECCNNLTSITIPDSVTSIGNGAFSACKGLDTIIIGDGVRELNGFDFFKEYPNLTNITIGNSVMRIDDLEFEYCSSLERVTIGNSVTSIGIQAFYKCTGLTSVTIPDSVTSIGINAFAWCKSLTSVTIGNSVTSIGSDAFYSCESLTSITIPDSVTSIGDDAFCACTSLTSVTIPDSVTSIGSGAFYKCTGLTSVTIGNSVTIIGDWAFRACESLTSITIPDSVTSIGACAFYDCDSLTSVTIGNSVTSIDVYAFYNCTSLTSITVPDSVTNIGNWTFYNCYSLTSITIPDSVTSIGVQAFYNCAGLTSITIPDSVTSIGESTFAYCDSLTSVTIGDFVTSIGEKVFYYCSALTSINIPNSLKSVGDYSFSGCSKLVRSNYKRTPAWWYLVSVGTGNEYLSNSLICECDSDRPYYLPVKCGDDLRGIQYTDGELVITGSGAITSYAWRQPSRIYSVTLGRSVTGVVSNAFSKTNLISINVPKSITSLRGIPSDATVYYEGNEEQWQKLRGYNNYDFVYFNSYTSPDLPNPEPIPEPKVSGVSIYLDDIKIYEHEEKTVSYNVEVSTEGSHTEPEFRTTAQITLKDKDGNVLNTASDTIDSFLWNIMYYKGTALKDFKISGLGEGEYTVTVSCDGFSDSATIKVVKPTTHLSCGVTLTPKEISYQKKSYDTETVVAKFRFTNSMPSDYDGSIAEYRNNSDYDIYIGNAQITLDDSGFLTPKDGRNLKFSVNKYLSAGESCYVEYAFTINKKYKPSENSDSDLISFSTAVDAVSTVGGRELDKTINATVKIINKDYIEKLEKEKEEWEEEQAKRKRDFEKKAKEVAEQIDKYMEDHAGEILLPPTLNLYLSDDQIEAVKREILLNILMPTALDSKFYDELKEWADEKVKDGLLLSDEAKEFLDAVETVNKYKYDNEELDMTMIIQTEDHGEVKLKITGSLFVMSGSDDPMAKNGSLNISLDGKKVHHSTTGGLTIVNAKNMENGARDIVLDYIEYVYDDLHGDDLDKVADMILPESTKAVMEFCETSASEVSYELMTAPGKKASYRCPVDIFVYNSKDELCASAVNDIVTLTCDEASITVIGDEKIVYLVDDSYKIVAKPTGDGTMQVEIEEFANYDGSVRKIEINDIPLEFGKHYTQTINPDILTDEESYALTSLFDDNTISPDNVISSLHIHKDEDNDEYCDVCGFILVSGEETEPANITVNMSDISMTYKTATTVSPVIECESEYTVTYSSSNTSVATIDNSGKVTATGRGTATITCTVTDEYGNSVSDTCTVTVKYAWWQWIIIILLFGWIWY